LERNAKDPESHREPHEDDRMLYMELKKTENPNLLTLTLNVQ